MSDSLDFPDFIHLLECKILEYIFSGCRRYTAMEAAIHDTCNAIAGVCWKHSKKSGTGPLMLFSKPLLQWHLVWSPKPDRLIPCHVSFKHRKICCDFCNVSRGSVARLVPPHVSLTLPAPAGYSLQTRVWKRLVLPTQKQRIIQNIKVELNSDAACEYLLSLKKIDAADMVWGAISFRAVAVWHGTRRHGTATLKKEIEE